MKKLLSVILCAVLVLPMSVLYVSADADELSADIYVTIADKDGVTVVPGEKITVTDTDHDGVLTINDALYTAHEVFYDGGAAAGYATSVSEYGLGLTKLWGTANGGSYGYYLNNVSAWALTDPVSSGDYLAAFVYTDFLGWSDHYSYFDNLFYVCRVGETLTFTYYEAGYDEDWNPVTLPVNGAHLTLDGKDSGFNTNPYGTVKLTFPRTGTYRLGATAEGKRLVAPVAYLTVLPAPTLIGDADGDATVTILDATRIQRFLADMVTGEAFDEANADADRDYAVTILDATAIQRYLVHLIDEL